jgi:hypothetical protein
MIPIIIGVSASMLLVLLLLTVKQFNTQLVCGLVLTGIGFLYIGYTWTDRVSLIINCIQAVVFLVLAYFGVKRSIYVLSAGFFLHGIWDLVYDLFAKPGLVPPHYDLFCLSYDFVIGIYLLFVARKSWAAYKVSTM